ncbi:hypothetical protein F5X99DRAFT_375565 [Biscogniauxia marginata]|nr:hypothetical protein F5X99DRAFT_375565 [Biscogniauxia marginata]
MLLVASIPSLHLVIASDLYCRLSSSSTPTLYIHAYIYTHIRTYHGCHPLPLQPSHAHTRASRSRYLHIEPRPAYLSSTSNSPSHFITFSLPRLPTEPRRQLLFYLFIPFLCDFNPLFVPSYHGRHSISVPSSMLPTSYLPSYPISTPCLEYTPVFLIRFPFSPLAVVHQKSVLILYFGQV